ncbi:MAG: TAXI family TRAP transporter solute-binding subunit [Ectothiorhodospiraceae bacterium]|nr:TAXI family TRAP transporter solute-binding subunit [Ectothiorhodospiraceae bacterium]
MYRRILKTGTTLAGGLAALGLAMSVQAGEPELPGTIVWTTYESGSEGFNQAVAIGSVIQRQHRTNLRVLPGRNDMARLSPLRLGRAQFAADGSPSIYAQEAILDFSTISWGPQPVRLVMWSLSDSCSFTLHTTRDSGIEHIRDIKGKRVTYVQAAAGLNNATTAVLAYGGLTWDDVERVEVGGFLASVDAVVANRADVFGAGCNSGPLMRVDSAPRGLRTLGTPHDDPEGIQRARALMPWYIPSVATEGVVISEDSPLEVIHAPYPQLVTMKDQSEDLVYNMTKAMHQNYERFKDNAPGLYGWSMDRQAPENAFMPFHEGAVRYFKEIGLWTDEAEENQQRNLRRQELLAEAWKAYLDVADLNDESAFASGWMDARAEALRDAGMITIMDRW